jgi:hypothetical protein
MTPIRLIAKTARGRRKLKSGLPSEWFVLDGPRSVQCFNGDEGILVGLKVDTMEKIPKAFDLTNRWIRVINDPDFQWEYRDEDQ